MKKTVFLLLIIIGFAACEDEDLRNSDVPSVVQNGFAEQFPNATGIEWEKKADFYEVDFDLENVDYEAILNTDGTIEKYKYDITYQELPEAVQATITADFDQTRVDDVELISLEDTNYYQVEFEGDLNDKKRIFKESGEVTSEISKW